MRGTGTFVLLLVVVGALLGAGSHRGAQPAAARLNSLTPAGGWSPAEKTGLATFYGADFHGKVMANGRVFDMYDPGIAASNDWPLGTRLLIRRIPGSPWESLLSQAEQDRYYARSLVVTVQDRGKFTHPLDLSLGAFRVLGRPDEGVIHVQIEVVHGPVLATATAEALASAAR